MTDTGPPAFDAARLIADLRLGKPEAIEQAYRLTFDHAMGRLVLAHFMMECGVGSPIPQEVTDGQLRYLVGQHNAAVALAARAGFDPPSLIAKTFSENLEGNTDDRSYNHDPGHGAGGGWPDYVPGPDDQF